MANWTEIVHRPNDKERQDAHNTGVGGYGGEDTKQKEIRQTVLPSGES